MTEYVFRNNAYARECQAVVTHSDSMGVRLDRTVCYPMGGGQPGDTGVMRWQGGEAQIIDSKKIRLDDNPDHDDVLHVMAAGSLLPAIGDNVTITLDWNRRYRHMRMHSSLHLLTAVMPYPVTGGQVGSDKSRLDFDIPDEIYALLDKEKIAAELNQLISKNYAIEERWITDDELRTQPELVKTMSVKPPMGAGRVRLLKVGENVDLQPCGGTHVLNTSEIGKIEIQKIENKGKSNRRIIVALVA